MARREYSQDFLHAIWWSQTESNRRHPACKTGALPTELWPRNDAQGWDRTTAARAFNAPLYRWATCASWSGRGESNPASARRQRAALPLSYGRRFGGQGWIRTTSE